MAVNAEQLVNKLKKIPRGIRDRVLQMNAEHFLYNQNE